MSLKIRRGDTVQVISGDDRGKVGRVLSVDEVKSRVLIEKVNFVKRHTKAASTSGAASSRRAPIHLSKVSSTTRRAAGAHGIRTLPDGKPRVSKVTGEVLTKSE
jgi:large subunit ribosomal protein L24